MDYAVIDNFDMHEMQDFRRRPDVFWPGADALSPPPDALNFVEHMLHPDVWTVAGTYKGQIIGYVEFNKRTSVGAEIHVGFHPQFRGRVAKAVTQYAIAQAFQQKGLLKLWAIIPSDNRPALYGARLLGFHEEGRLTKAVIRQHPTSPLTDLVILGMEKTHD